MRLSKPQRTLLEDLPSFTSGDQTHVESTYKPGQKLVALGLAEVSWKSARFGRVQYMRRTPAGDAAVAAMDKR